MQNAVSDRGQHSSCVGRRKQGSTPRLGGAFRCLSLVMYFSLAAVACRSASPEQIPVKYEEGVTHGFLTLRTPQGAIVANGEISQTAKDGIVKDRLTFHFKDGSIYEDETIFSQRGRFRLVRDHVVQQGPAFVIQMESMVDASNGRVTVHSAGTGKERDLQESLDLPADLSNGMIFTLVKNIPPQRPTTVSYLTFTPKPLLVRLTFNRQGKDKLKTGSLSYSASRFVMTVEIGGVRGFLTHLFRKAPPPASQFWIADQGAPTVVASEGPLYGGGPVWRIDLVSPNVSLSSDH